MTISPDYAHNGITLYRGDCLDIMPHLKGVDAVICDPPYGTTACAWDSVIPLDKMWECVKGLIKKRGAIALFGKQPFSSFLVTSKIEWFRYSWVWKKPKAANFISANFRPLSVTEDVLVFSPSPSTFTVNENITMIYNPQKTKGGDYVRAFNATDKKFTKGSYSTKRGGKHNIEYFGDGKPIVYEGRFPTNLLEYGEETSDHPTQKPLALMEYLVLTYTNEGDTVLDFTMGSGTTGVACAKLGRKFIGIERDPAYFDIALNRIKNAAGEFVPTEKEKSKGKNMMLF